MKHSIVKGLQGTNKSSTRCRTYIDCTQPHQIRNTNIFTTYQKKLDVCKKNACLFIINIWYGRYFSLHGCPSFTGSTTYTWPSSILASWGFAWCTWLVPNQKIITKEGCLKLRFNVYYICIYIYIWNMRSDVKTAVIYTGNSTWKQCKNMLLILPGGSG